MARESVNDNSRRKLVESELFEQAAILFAERGFEATTLNDVGQALGLTRAALYHYIKSKDELLERLVTDLTQSSARVLHDLRADTSFPPREKLREAVVRLATWSTDHPARLKLLERVEYRLPPKADEEHRRAKREVFIELKGIIREGIDAGVLRSVDEKVAAFFLIGACNWIAWWYSPDHGTSAEVLIAEFADLAIHALETRERPDDAGMGLHGALARLREDVQFFERLIENT